MGICGPAIPPGVFQHPRDDRRRPLQWNSPSGRRSAGSAPSRSRGCRTARTHSGRPGQLRAGQGLDHVRLPNGSTANISPHVISQAARRARGRADQVGPQAARVRQAASTPGISAAIASATRLPISDSRAGRRRAGCRTAGCRSPGSAAAVLALAASTIALTSGRCATPGSWPCGYAARPLDVAALDHQLEHRVARAGVDPLCDQNIADHQVRRGACGRR